MFHWRSIIFQVRSSFWFIPGLMAIVAVAGAWLFAEFGFGFDAAQGFRAVKANEGMPIDSARAILSTIAGSMITVTTLVFSMTFVAMTLVAQQLGPRIILRFMDNRPTQVFLGLFLATFLFALIVMVRIGFAEADRQVPNLAVLVSAGLVILSMGAIIAFIHNVANRIQADQLVAELGGEFEAAAVRLVRRDEAEDVFATEAELEEIADIFEKRHVVPVSPGESGYLNLLDEQSALAWAVENDAFVQIVVHSGQFVLEGTPVLEVAVENTDGARLDHIRKEIRKAVSVAAKRTAEATLEFEVNALTEVALRALSPGINDPYTARACIHRLGAGLKELLDHPGRPAVVRDEEGRVRVVHNRQPFGYYCSLALRPLMRASREHAEVLGEIAEMLGLLGAMTSRQDRRDDILVHLDALEETLEAGAMIEADKAWLRKEVAAARKKADAHGGPVA